MLIASRKYAFILLAGLAFLAVGCSSNNKGKIEGKWKITALPEKGSGKNDMAEMTKVGIYVYMEFKPDGGLVFGVSSDKPEVLDFMKAQVRSRSSLGMRSTSFSLVTPSR